MGCPIDPARRDFERAEGYLSEGDHKKALDHYSYVVNKFENSPYGPKSQYKIGLIYARHLKDVKGASAAYRTLYYLYPKSPEAVLGRRDMAELYSSNGDHGKAIEEYQKLIRINPPEERRYKYLIAMEYLMKGDFRQARSELKELADMIVNPNMAPRIAYEIAGTYYLEGKISEAIKRYDEVVERYPEHQTAVDALFDKARALEDSGHPEEALEILRGLKGRYPNEDVLATRIGQAEKMSREPSSRKR